MQRTGAGAAGGGRSQRWRDRRDRYVPNASIIAPAEYAVDGLEEARAKPFVIQHHYSASFPAARLSVGLFRKARLVGVATFSVPMNNRATTRHAGVEPRHGVELGRFVLLDEVAGNGETWFLARALTLLRREKPEVLAVISYADPVPRVTDAGMVKPGHIGIIYQGMSAAYRGRGEARTTDWTPDGRPFSPRAASKVRNRECGHAYAVDELVRRGAPCPQPDDDLRSWYDGLLATGFLQRRRHPGNHVYSFALTQAAKLAGRNLPQPAYPQPEQAGVEPLREGEGFAG